MTKELRLCNATAYRKNLAVKAMRGVPELGALIAEGVLTLSSVASLQAAIMAEERATGVQFTAEERCEFFSQIENKTARETEIFIADHFQVGHARPESVRAVASGRFEICMTLSAEQMAKLEKVRAHRSHARFNASYAETLEDLCDLYLRRQERPMTRTASDTEAPRSFQTQRKEVFRRDGKRCSYHDPRTKRRCEATSLLEIDHIRPRARGGTDELSNLRVLCRTHNQLRNQTER